jgi:hypothetical protein
VRADNSQHVIAAARRRADETRQRAITTLRRMDAAGQLVTFDAVSRSPTGWPGLGSATGRYSQLDGLRADP